MRNVLVAVDRNMDEAVDEDGARLEILARSRADEMKAATGARSSRIAVNVE